MDQNLDMLDELEPMQAELQQQSMELQMEQMENLFNDTEQLVIGMAADEKARAIYFDAMVTSKAGSKMAEQLAESKKSRSLEILRLPDGRRCHDGQRDDPNYP
jgi:hypothetical protein